MNRLPDRLLPGSPYPLGATFDGLGVNFAVFSAHAEQIDLCLFDPSGKREIARLPLPEWTDEVWHGYLPDARPGMLYGLRAHGPYQPEQGHRFNPNKLLIDPYARKLHGTVRWTDALHGYRVGSNKADLSFDRRDSAPAVPKSVVTADAFDWTGDVRPNTPWAKTVIYGALTYFISPIDAVPDITPVLGYSDDLGVLVSAVLTVAMYVSDEVKQQARDKVRAWFS